MGESSNAPPFHRQSLSQAFWIDNMGPPSRPPSSKKTHRILDLQGHIYHNTKTFLICHVVAGSLCFFIRQRLIPSLLLKIARPQQLTFHIFSVTYAGHCFTELLRSDRYGPRFGFKQQSSKSLFQAVPTPWIHYVHTASKRQWKSCRPQIKQWVSTEPHLRLRWQYRCIRHPRIPPLHRVLVCKPCESCATSPFSIF